jgi:hypothetical protein
MKNETKNEQQTTGEFLRFEETRVDVYVANYELASGEIVKIEASYGWTQIRFASLLDDSDFEEWSLCDGTYHYNDGLLIQRLSEDEADAIEKYIREGASGMGVEL